MWKSRSRLKNTLGHSPLSIQSGFLETARSFTFFPVAGQSASVTELAGVVLGGGQRTWTRAGRSGLSLYGARCNLGMRTAPDEL